MENWLHLEAESSTGRHTHSTVKPQMAVGDSERHPEEGTAEERETKTAGIKHVFHVVVLLLLPQSFYTVAPLHQHEQKLNIAALHH